MQPLILRHVETLADSTILKEIARVACAAFPKGNRYLTFRDELGTAFNDDVFAHIFPKVGQPAEAP